MFFLSSNVKNSLHFVAPVRASAILVVLRVSARRREGACKRGWAGQRPGCAQCGCDGEARAAMQRPSALQRSFSPQGPRARRTLSFSPRPASVREFEIPDQERRDKQEASVRAALATATPRKLQRTVSALNRPQQ